jgi:hypothetical protein
MSKFTREGDTVERGGKGGEGGEEAIEAFRLERSWIPETIVIGGLEYRDACLF